MGDDSGGLTPVDKSKLTLSSTKSTAAGIPAVLSSAVHSMKKMGVTKSVKTLRMVNQKAGFDCPGCAWPDPEHRSSFEFCENGAKAVADEAMKANVDRNFFSKYSINELASKSDYWLNSQGRIAEPVYAARNDTHYKPISWSEAFNIIANKLKSLSSPHKAAFYTSGRTSNEAAFLYQAFVRMYGTNNLPDCSNMCHESSGKALISTIGIGKGTVSLNDFNHAETILVIGQNPGTNHPRMLTALRDAKEKGAKIIHINPLTETGLIRFKHPQDYMRLNFSSTKLSDIHLPIRIGGDAALFQAINKIIIDSKALDTDFIQSKTRDFDQYRDSLADLDWARIVNDTGITRSEIENVASILIDSKSIISCWAMGLTQHKNGVAVIQEVVNLHLLGGNIGRKGAGLCPVRGHSNVQGNRTLGIWEAPSELFINDMELGLNMTMPRNHGYDVVNSIKAMESSDLEFLFCLGGNFVSASPDSIRTSKAIGNLSMGVHVSTKLNRSHLIQTEENLILPCLGRTELDKQDSGNQFVSVENSMGVVHMSRGTLKPASPNLRSEPWIIAELAARTLDDSTIDYQLLAKNYDGIRDLIGKCVAGFEDYNNRVRMENGFFLPNPPKDMQEFETEDGLAHFSINDLPDVSLKSGEFVMMTIRSHDQYNTTIYGLDDRYRGIKGNRRIVMMNPDDMLDLSIKTRDKINITSHFNGSTIESSNWTVIPYKIPKRNIAAYFPEANELVPLESTADISNTPTSKWIICTISGQISASEEE
ncbi:MAG: FdhF/YdeP family oxidoreductase [Candidatus Thermoplasmatota archaeon]|nr:FdhF/YdeP family oxidoreductase [Candidatus Thermoplasmatota archaeon]